ncbi:MAG TPA: hypothetical protein VNE62_01470 [Actinomycetota bacterium]|nr:hypothetical protein [Actinomycetota bacterium]
MNRPVSGRARRRSIVVRVAAVSVAAALGLVPDAAVASGTEPERIVLFAMPAVTWDDIRPARMPALQSVISRGAVAAISVRSAASRTDPVRGYMTLGSGNRAYSDDAEPQAHLAFSADAPFESGTAEHALRRRIGPTGAEAPEPADASSPGLVHLGLPWLDKQAARSNYGTAVGSLGETLRHAGVRRAVVSAADTAVDPRASASRRREAVLGMVDRTGRVEDGTVSGLLRTDPDAPFGVSTDAAAFEAAARTALSRSRVVLLEPGETLRADQFLAYANPDRRQQLVTGALERSDVILSKILPALTPRDRLYIVVPSGPSLAATEHLTPLVAAGAGVRRGWLTSATTRQPGMATLSDVAPTVLDAFGLRAPGSMTGTVISSIRTQRGGRVADLAALDRESVFREHFAAQAVYAFITMLTLLSLLSFVVFLSRSRAWSRLLTPLALAVLAVPPAALVWRAVDADRLGMTGAHLVLWGLVAVLAAAAAAVPGPRWAGGVALLLLSAVMLSVDLAAGSPLQLNGIFGFSPIVAGRFYGIGNLGYAILMASGILGLTGLVELRGLPRAPAIIAVGLAVLVLVDGLPQLGADFGGVLGGVPAVLLTYMLARGHRVRWPVLLAAGAAAVAVASGLALLDLSRPPEVRTHLGRFAARVASGGLPALVTVVRRKAQANLGVLGVSSWTYTIPLTLGVLALMLARPVGVLRDVLPRHPVLRAGLIGAMAAGVGGYAVNDSGIAIPAMVLGHVVPLLVLLAVQTLAPRPAAAAKAA